ncbi:MAG: hypothetical protein PVJ61_01900 [Dehalococcoidia bacterium]
MATNKNTDVKRVYNPVSLGTLYFGFSAALWSSDQVSNCEVRAIAIAGSVITLAFFIAVFSQHVLTFLSSKWMVSILVPLTSIALFVGFALGWLQAILQTSGVPLQIVAYLGFAWIIVFLLILVRDTIKEPTKKKRISPTLVRFRACLPYFIFAIFLIFAGVKLLNQDVWSIHFWKSVNFWSSIYSLGIAGLVLSVARGWLKVRGEIFERPS